MAGIKCDLRYCAATVGDFEEVANVIKCKCVFCNDAQRELCEIYKEHIETGVDTQRQMCSVCKFYNGR